MAEIAFEGARKLRENAKALRESMDELDETRPAFHARLEKILSNLPEGEIIEVPAVPDTLPQEDPGGTGLRTKLRAAGSGIKLKNAQEGRFVAKDTPAGGIRVEGSGEGEMTGEDQLEDSPSETQREK